MPQFETLFMSRAFSTPKACQPEYAPSILAVHFAAKRTAKVFERTNRNRPARNTLVQHLALYTDESLRHAAQRTGVSHNRQIIVADLVQEASIRLRGQSCTLAARQMHTRQDRSSTTTWPWLHVWHLQSCVHIKNWSFLTSTYTHHFSSTAQSNNTDHESQNAQRHRQTDRHTGGRTDRRRRQDYVNSRS